MAIIVEKKKQRFVTMYIKNMAFVLTPKFCAFLQSPLNIKFDI